MSVLNYPTSIALPPAPLSAPRGLEPDQILTLADVPYVAYVQMADAIMDHPRVRFTYDRGTLEIMTTSNRHEWYKGRIGLVIHELCAALNRAYMPGGSQTLRNEELERGFEPDQCYWIANESKVREPFFLWDPNRYPPPDLVVEIEVSRSAVKKLSLLAAYRVPEVWRFDEQALRLHLLQENGCYQEALSSPNFPSVPIAGLLPHILPNPEVDILTWARNLRSWIQSHRART
jgi:Uma2 family endonuclease